MIVPESLEVGELGVPQFRGKLAPKLAGWVADLNGVNSWCVPDKS